MENCSQPRWYKMLDAAPNGVSEIAPSDAERWNAQGHGIFWTVNAFNGARRIENLAAILAWAVDMDDGTKDGMRKRLSEGPLVPSLVVETKRGYQAYWRAKDAIASHWNAIVLDRLVPYYGADKNARDLARILRVPGYMHLKDPADPFRVRTVHSFDVSYSERQIVEAYPAPHRATEDKKTHEAVKRDHKAEGDDFWTRVWNLDCEQALERLSAVTGEHYTFRGNRNGGKNILVDGKGTSCWVDANGRIGSLSSGGPTVFQWLCWYGTSKKDAIEILKRTFPELTR